MTVDANSPVVSALAARVLVLDSSGDRSCWMTPKTPRTQTAVMESPAAGVESVDARRESMDSYRRYGVQCWGGVDAHTGGFVVHPLRPRPDCLLYQANSAPNEDVVKLCC
ncbi:uncharacterized, partial [Lates japonicus]